MFKMEAPGRIFGHVEEKVMNDGENYIMRSMCSSPSKGVLNEQALCNSKGVDEIILNWMLKNEIISAWTGSSWLRIVLTDDCYEQSNET
jgi:hypothetical protein